MPEIEDLQSWIGAEVVDPGDDKIGKLSELYLDRTTGEPTYGVVKSGLLGRTHVVPLAGATFSRGHVRLTVSKDLATASPVAADDAITAGDEVALARHFGTSSPVDAGDPDEVRHESATSVAARRAESEAALRRADELEREAAAKDQHAAELMDAANQRASTATDEGAERDRLLAEAAAERARAQEG